MKTLDRTLLCLAVKSGDIKMVEVFLRKEIIGDNWDEVGFYKDDPIYFLRH